MREYDEAHNDGADSEAYAAAPLPTYLEEEHDDNYLPASLQDVCYHLLKLYCDRAHPLHILLNPAASTPDHLDYRLRYAACDSQIIVLFYLLDYCELLAD